MTGIAGSELVSRTDRRPDDRARRTTEIFIRSFEPHEERAAFASAGMTSLLVRRLTPP